VFEFIKERAATSVWGTRVPCSRNTHFLFLNVTSIGYRLAYLLLMENFAIILIVDTFYTRPLNFFGVSSCPFHLFCLEHIAPSLSLEGSSLVACPGVLLRFLYVIPLYRKGLNSRFACPFLRFGVHNSEFWLHYRYRSASTIRRCITVIHVILRHIQQHRLLSADLTGYTIHFSRKHSLSPQMLLFPRFANRSNTRRRVSPGARPRKWARSFMCLIPGIYVLSIYIASAVHAPI